jgi:hypothetical protein
MKKFLRPIFIASLAALLLAAAGVPSDAARRAPGTSAYDGQWSVTIYTLYGDCDRALRYSLRIAGGRVLAEDQSFQAAGGVTSAGAIHVVVAQGGQSASGYGRLRGVRGQGRWRTSTGKCAGKWTAERRG